MIEIVFVHNSGIIFFNKYLDLYETDNTVILINVYDMYFKSIVFTSSKFAIRSRLFYNAWQTSILLVFVNKMSNKDVG